MNITVPDDDVIHHTFHQLCIDATSAKIASIPHKNSLFITRYVLAQEAAMEAYKEAILNDRIYEFMAKRH